MKKTLLFVASLLFLFGCEKKPVEQSPKYTVDKVYVNVSVNRLEDFRYNVKWTNASDPTETKEWTIYPTYIYYRRIGTNFLYVCNNDNIYMLELVI